MPLMENARVVSALGLVEALADAAGCRIEIERNAGAALAGELIHAGCSLVNVDGDEKDVVHLLVRRSIRDGTTPVMVSLLTGVDADEDFFWPACRITVTCAARSEQFLLR